MGSQGDRDRGRRRGERAKGDEDPREAGGGAGAGTLRRRGGGAAEGASGGAARKNLRPTACDVADHDRSARQWMGRTCLVLRRRLVVGLQTVVDTVRALCNFLKQLCSKQAPLLNRLRLHSSLVLALDIIHERVVPLRCQLLRLLAEKPHGEGPQVAKFCVTSTTT